RLRKLSRLVGAIYDAALRPSGLRGTQFNVLVALALLREGTVKRLAVTLAMGRATLSRRPAPLERARPGRRQPGAELRRRVRAGFGADGPRTHTPQVRDRALGAGAGSNCGETRAREVAAACDESPRGCQYFCEELSAPFFYSDRCICTYIIPLTGRKSYVG